MDRPSRGRRGELLEIAGGPGDKRQGGSDLRGELEAARGGHAQAAAVGDNGDRGGRTKGEFDGPKAGGIVGWIDEERAIEKRRAIRGRAGEERRVGTATATDPDDGPPTPAPSARGIGRGKRVACKVGEDAERGRPGLGLAGGGRDVGRIGGAEPFMDDAAEEGGGRRREGGVMPAGGDGSGDILGLGVIRAGLDGVDQPGQAMELAGIRGAGGQWITGKHCVRVQLNKGESRGFCTVSEKSYVKAWENRG